MNEEELRLLQAAVGTVVPPIETTTAAATPPTDAITVDADINPSDLPEEDLERLLAQLQAAPSEPEVAQHQTPVLDEHAHHEQQPQPQQQQQQQQQDTGPDADFNINLDQSVVNAIVNALANVTSQESQNEDVKNEQNEPSLFEPVRAYSVHSQDSTPTPNGQSPEPGNSDASYDMLRQRQEQAGMLITNELYRQRAGAQRNQSYSPNGGDRRDSEGAGSMGYEDPIKAADRERIREENRERKKRWREVNQDRNKDNDLRCRVTKRATRLFGPGNTPAKTAWIANEFNKRKQKREQKEKSRSGEGSGSSGVFNAAGPNHSHSFINPADAGGMIQKLVNPSDPQSHINFDLLVDVLVKAPEIVSQLQSLAAEIKVMQTPNNLQFPQQMPCLQAPPPAPPAQGQLNYASPPVPEKEPQSVDDNPFNNLLRSLAHRGEEVPEGFDLLLAELQGDGKPSTEPEPTVETVQSPQDDDLDDADLDDLLAALAAADQDPEAAKDALEELLIDHDIEELNELLGLDTDGDKQMADDTTLEKLIGEFGLETLEGALADADVSTIDEVLAAVASADSSAESASAPGETAVAPTERVVAPSGTAAAPSESAMAAHGIDSMEVSGSDTEKAPGADSTEVRGNDGGSGAVAGSEDMMQIDVGSEAENLSMDEINTLLTQLNGEGNNDGSSALDGQIMTEQQSQQSASVESTVQSAPSGASGEAPQQQYTPETVAAILKAIFEGIRLPVASVPQEPRPSKRASPASHIPAPPPAKRLRGPSPNVSAPSAADRLQGIVQSSANIIRPPSTTSPVPPAYAASFGNTEDMNKRLMAMKPPPYRPPTNTASTASAAPIPSVPLMPIPPPPKRKEDEKKIKAMGFPPLLVPLKRKAD